jgi:transcriptional regulator with XRE-family HTH domain
MRTDERWVIRTPGDVGRLIADLRSKQALTQIELARQTGIPREYLARLENGRSVEMLDRTLLLLRRLGAEMTVTAPLAGTPDA